MKTVKLRRERVPDRIVEIEIPEGVIKEKVYDYQDPAPYDKYFYISKKGNKKECKIKWV
jgi:hypothetical protein